MLKSLALLQEVLVAVVISLIYWRMPRNVDHVEDRKTIVSSASLIGRQSPEPRLHWAGLKFRPVS